MESNPFPLLILDLDETLIHSTESSLGFPADFRVGPYQVYLRPHLNVFLTECQKRFRLAVWSSSTQDYLSPIVRRIFHEHLLEFVWGREKCSHRWDAEQTQNYFVKDLKKVRRRGFDLERVLIVDDTPQKCERNYGNAVYLRPFVGDRNDQELKFLGPYLESLSWQNKLRGIEKRGWRNRFFQRLNEFPPLLEED